MAHRARRNPEDLILAGLATVGVGIAAFAASRLSGGSRLSQVLALFEQSKGVRYSWAGGHKGYTWPYGGKGEYGGVGWDCSGWVKAVMAQAGRKAEGNSSDLWAAFGTPRNGLAGAKPGDIIWWGSGKPQHVGFVVSPTEAVSAFGGGSSTNADNPNAFVKRHKINYGTPVIGTASW